MSSGSLWGGTVRFDETDHDNGESLGSMEARRLVNNLDHLLDSCGQVLVAEMPVANGVGLQREVDTARPGLHKTWGPFALMTYGGSSYKVRVRIRGRITISGAAQSGYLVLHPRGVSPVGEITTTGARAHVTTVTIPDSTSSSWWTTGSNVLQLDESLLAQARQERSTLTGISGVPTTVLFCEAFLSFVTDANANKRIVELTGAYAAELWPNAG